MSARPWFSQYDAGVPFQLTYPEVCVHDLLTRIVVENEQRVAIESGGRSITYGEIDQASTNMATHLVALGVMPGEVVGICLTNSSEFVISFFAILKSGGVVAAMNPAFPKRELQFQVAGTGMRIVITSGEKAKDFVEIAGEKESITHLILREECEGVESRGLVRELRYRDLISDGAVDTRLPSIYPSQAAVVQFSGGTTGTPKAALGSHHNLVSNATQFRRWLVNLEDSQETFLIAIPLYHVYGLVLGLILGVACAAKMVIIEHPGNVDEIIEAIRNYPISYFPAVPTIFQRINQHADVIHRKISLATIKACISGSAPLLDSVRREFESNTGGSLVEGYGLSEAPTATHCNPILGQKRSGSIGLPLPDVDCRIVSMEDGVTEVSTGMEGELLVRGPQVMLGYLNAPEDNKLSLRDGWLRTGDIARMDKDGYFYLAGRIKDLIKVHGMQVWPSEVEVVVNQHPAVMECAVAGVLDEKSGERVKVWVVLRPGMSLSHTDLIEFCRGKLAAYKIPVEMETRENLPRTSVGKVLRRVLVEENKT